LALHFLLSEKFLELSKGSALKNPVTGIVFRGAVVAAAAKGQYLFNPEKALSRHVGAKRVTT